MVVSTIVALAALGGCLLLLTFLFVAFALMKRGNKLKNERRRSESPRSGANAQRPHDNGEYATIDETQREQSNAGQEYESVGRARAPTNATNTGNDHLINGASSRTKSEMARAERADQWSMLAVAPEKSTKTSRKESSTNTTQTPTVQYSNAGELLADSRDTNVVYAVVVAKKDRHTVKDKHTQKQNECTAENSAIGSSGQEISDVYSTLHDTTNANNVESNAASNTYDIFARG